MQAKTDRLREAKSWRFLELKNAQVVDSRKHIDRFFLMKGGMHGRVVNLRIEYILIVDVAHCNLNALVFVAYLSLPLSRE